MPSSSFLLRSSTTFISILSLFSSHSFAAPHIARGFPQQSYTLAKEYSGSTFFDQFSFFDRDDPTHGFVTYGNRQYALDNSLISFDGTYNYMSVDSTNGVKTYSKYQKSDYYGRNGVGRKSVRIEGNYEFTHGLIVTDVAHMPSGICGAWPAFWTLGKGTWPYNGEIDIIEGAHTQGGNWMTLHAGGQSSISQTGDMSGTVSTTNCNTYPNTGDYTDPNPNFTGCKITDSDTSTWDDYQGGVWATQWTSNFIKIWFFPYSSVPSDLNTDRPNPDNWPTPRAFFNPSETLNADANYKMHHIIFDTTFCGDLGDAVWESSGCRKQTGSSTCAEYVAKNPAAFANAYWKVKYVKIYENSGASSTTSKSTTTNTPTSATTATTTSHSTTIGTSTTTTATTQTVTAASTSTTDIGTASTSTTVAITTQTTAGTTTISSTTGTSTSDMSSSASSTTSGSSTTSSIQSTTSKSTSTTSSAFVSTTTGFPTSTSTVSSTILPTSTLPSTSSKPSSTYTSSKTTKSSSLGPISSTSTSTGLNENGSTGRGPWQTWAPLTTSKMVVDPWNTWSSIKPSSSKVAGGFYPDKPDEDGRDKDTDHWVATTITDIYTIPCTTAPGYETRTTIYVTKVPKQPYTVSSSVAWANDDKYIIKTITDVITVPCTTAPGYETKTTVYVTKVPVDLASTWSPASISVNPDPVSTWVNAPISSVKATGTKPWSTSTRATIPADKASTPEVATLTSAWNSWSAADATATGVKVWKGAGTTTTANTLIVVAAALLGALLML